MNSILEKSRQAHDCTQVSPLVTLVRPGLHKFLFRFWVDRTWRTTPVDASLFFGGHIRHGYHAHAVPNLGVVETWQGSLSEANSRFKDILFLP